MYEEPHIIIEIYNREHNRCALCVLYDPLKSTSWKSHPSPSSKLEPSLWFPNHERRRTITMNATSQADGVPRMLSEREVWHMTLHYLTPHTPTRPRRSWLVPRQRSEGQGHKTPSQRYRSLFHVIRDLPFPKALGLLADPKWARKSRFRRYVEAILGSSNKPWTCSVDDRLWWC